MYATYLDKVVLPCDDLISEFDRLELLDVPLVLVFKLGSELLYQLDYMVRWFLWV